MSKSATQMIVLFLALSLLTGCAFFKLKEEIEVMETNVGIGGEINSSSPQQLPLTVILYSEVEGKKQIQNFQIVNPDNKDIWVILGLAPPATNRRLL